jgi:hypothetical protein
MNLIKLLNGNQFHEIPDHKVILEEALIVLRHWFIFENIGKRLSIDETPI